MTLHTLLVLVPALALPVLFGGASPALAAWPNGDSQVTVSAAAGDESAASVSSDGSGGMIAAWLDTRSGNSNVYAQRVGSDGLTRWTSNGVPVSVFAGTKTYVRVLEDGTGGTFVAWEDHRNDPFNADIYAQHLTSTGTVWPGWPASGMQVTAVLGDQDQPFLARDGSGGVYVAWHDYRFGTADIFVQRLAAGGVAAGWPANGLAVCVQPNDQGPVSIASDGAGGAYVAWHDGRNVGTTGFDVYVQRVLPGGTAGWAANGILACNSGGDQLVPVVAATTLGATVVWNDHRSAGAGSDIYSQFVSSSGSLSFPSGSFIAGGSGDQKNPAVVAAAAFTALVAWEDHGTDAAGDIAGSLIEFGTSSGVVLCAAAGAQTGPIAVTDGAAGAIFTWSDNRSGLGGNIYAQRLGSNNQALWAANGLRMSPFNNVQVSPAAVADARGGALIAFSQSAGTFNIVAQRADHFGYRGEPAPVITSARDIAGDQGGLVHLNWSASYLDTDPSFTIGSYNVWRRVTTASALLQLMARGARSVGPDERVEQGPALRTITSGVSSQTWEFLGTVPARGYATYGFPATTLADSMAGSPGYTVFMVDAQASSGPAFWSSFADSGYSVDNLAPATPAALTGNYFAGATHLHWDRNSETDLAGYRLYRGTTASFVPSPANFVASPADTGYADAGAAGGYYKISATDVHGNESGFASLGPDGTVEVPGDGAIAFGLEGVRPNPSVGSRLSVSFALASGAPAALDLFDIAGRRVESQDVGSLGAGRHVVNLAPHERLVPGLYFVRLQQGTEQRIERVTVLD